MSVSWSRGVSTLAALVVFGGCGASLPEDAASSPEAPASSRVESQEAGLDGLDLAAVELAASCDATALSLSAGIKNHGATGIAGSTAAIYAGDPSAGGVRLGIVNVPFLVGGETFRFQLSFTVPEGTTQVAVVAGEDRVYAEEDEANNLAAFFMPIPCATNQLPVALCQDVTVPADEACQASASIDVGSHDPDGFPGTASVTQSPAGPFSLGTTPVELVVSDGAASSTCSAAVTVVDTHAPAPGASKGLVLSPSAGSDYVLVSLADCALPATDNCGGTLDLQQAGTLLRVASDESDDALSLLRLLACKDIRVSADRKSALLRAEAALLGNGRVYTLTYEVRDAAGNASTGACKVSVPALLSPHAVDSGTVFCQGTGCPRGTTDHGLLCSL